MIRCVMGFRLKWLIFQLVGVICEWICEQQTLDKHHLKQLHRLWSVFRTSWTWSLIDMGTRMYCWHILSTRVHCHIPSFIICVSSIINHWLLNMSICCCQWIAALGIRHLASVTLRLHITHCYISHTGITHHSLLHQSHWDYTSHTAASVTLHACLWSHMKSNSALLHDNLQKVLLWPASASTYIIRWHH